MRCLFRFPHPEQGPWARVACLREARFGGRRKVGEGRKDGRGAATVREAFRRNDLQRIERIRNAHDAYSDEDRRRIEETVPKVGPDGTWRLDAERALEDLWGKGDEGLKDARAKIVLGFEDHEQRGRIEDIAKYLANGVPPLNPQGFRYVPTEVLRAAMKDYGRTEHLFNFSEAFGESSQLSDGFEGGAPGRRSGRSRARG